MALKLGKESPVNGLIFTNTQDDKFRTETVIVRFITPIGRVMPQRYRLVSKLLSESCARFPEKKLLSKEIMRLYGAQFGALNYSVGNYAVTGFSAISIADRFTFSGEKVTLELARLLLDCIFEPNLTDGLFDQTSFENAKHDLITMIRKQKNNRHSYALERARQLTFAGEPMELNTLGTLEDAEALTNECAAEAYKNLLDTAFISISFCGGGTNTEARQLIKERFTDFAKSRSYTGENIENMTTLSKIRTEPQFVTETESQSQSKLIIVYKFDGEDEFALRMASLIYGGTPFSKLFVNVREKLSLCYYCQSSVSGDVNTLVVDSGVGRGNEQKAIDEIKRQLELLKNGDFTDDELENTRRYYISAVRSAYDFSADMNAWFFRRFTRGDMLTPAEAEEMIKEVDRGRVLKALSSLVLDTVFVYEASENGTPENEEEEV